MFNIGVDSAKWRTAVNTDKCAVNSYLNWLRKEGLGASGKFLWLQCVDGSYWWYKLELEYAK